MKIEITKKQETVNDIVEEPKYSVFIERNYGTGDIHWSKTDWINDLDEEDMQELARTLSEKFPTPR